MTTKNLLLVLILTSFSSSMSACRRQKAKTQIANKEQTPSRRKDPVAAQDTLVQTPAKPIKIVEIPAYKPVEVNAVDFKFLSTKSKLTIKTETLNQNVVVSIRMKKDSIIWLSAGLMGIEGVRAIVSVDSIKMIDKINKKAYLFDFKTLSERFNFDLNFNLLQAIILGNMPLPQSLEDLLLIEADQQIIRQNRTPVVVDNFVNQKRLNRIKVVDEEGKSMAIDYADFQLVSSFFVPFLSNTKINFIKDGKSAESLLTIQHTKVEMPVEALAFPFAIPAVYEKKKF